MSGPQELLAVGWGSCSGNPERPCWHNCYADLNDPFTTEEALEYSKGREERMLACLEGRGPDWSGFADEYDERLDPVERERRAAEGRARQGFEA
jgi:hypothetical protein